MRSALGEVAHGNTTADDILDAMKALISSLSAG
jgi:hypothetical protein